MVETQLWDNIASFQIDDSEASLSFCKRLARENDWSIRYSERVISEYRRFIYLAAISKSEVTPSDQVDQAWHLHLTYTESYWNILCKEILGVELHHLPTKGGIAEQQRFRDQYRYTLELYQVTFKESPPDDIWPSVDRRFDAVESFIRVNTERRLLIPRPSPLVTNIALIASLPFFLISCSDDLSDTEIWFWLKLVFGIYILYRILKWLGSGGGKNSGSGGSGCGGCAGCGGCGG
ncbi:MAG: hypothetical protein ABW155_18160 [Candidatus Thiodiazotropha sp.]